MSNPNWGSVPILMYPIIGDEVNPIDEHNLLITDGTDFLLTDMTPLFLAGF